MLTPEDKKVVEAREAQLGTAREELSEDDTANSETIDAFSDPNSGGKQKNIRIAVAVAIVLIVIILILTR